MNNRHAVLTVVNTFKDKLTGKKLVLYIDNSTAVASIRKKWSNSMQIMMFIYDLCILMIKYKCLIYVDWISSNSNGVSDALSRCNWDTFWNIVNLYQMTINPLPTTSLYYNNFRFINNDKYMENKFINEYNEFAQFLNLPFNTRLQKGYYNYDSHFNLNNVI